MQLLSATLAIAWKDVRLEFRSRDTVVSALIFGLIVVVVFNFGLNRTPGSLAPVAPGLLWVAYGFVGVLAMNRAFAREQEQGALDGLLAAPVSRDAVFLGKMLGTLAFMLVIEAVLLPVFAVMLDLPTLSPTLGLIILLATVGFATVGTFFAAIAAQTRSREILLPVLFFPVIVPVIIAAVEATALVLQGGPMLPVWTRWLPLLVVFDALFLVICPWIFGYVFEG
ncbi:MAG: heme exporter protein CcmB [Chloroflexota bacterium]|nr:heme exporter protein CcmB [Chloroflexota bacterium]MDE2961769.1 heme exporter protein CcmB [Chloroflexota bacterium]